MSRSRTVLTLVVVSLILVAGCSGGGNSAAPQGGGGDGGAPRTAQAEATPTASESGDSSAAGAQVRYRIRRGSAVLEVDDYDDARRNLTSLAAAGGGYLSDASQRVHREGNATWTTGRLVLRVPAENFSETFSAVKRRGDVVEANIETTDVTGRVVDLEARLRNLRSERDRLRELYQEANDTSDVLQVEKRLSSVQSDIERLEAKLRSLEGQVNYATITVELREPRPEREPPEVTRWYDVGVVDAFLESVHGVVVVGRAMVVAAAYVAPYLLTFVLPVALAAAAVVRWRRGAILP
jgi:hypothetical protein